MKTLIISLLLAGLFPASRGIAQKGVGTSASALGNIDFNFWGLDGLGNPIDPHNGTGSDPHHWNAAITSQENALNITYDHSHTLNTLTAPMTMGAIITCIEEPFSKTHLKENKKSESILDTIPHDCNYSANLGVAYSQEGKYALSYDTLKNFIQRCPTNSQAPFAFGTMTLDVQHGGDGAFPGCLTDFRNWLLSALAWNPGNAQYFCADIGQLAGTFGNGATDWKDANQATNDGLAVIQWLIQNPLCNDAGLDELYTNSRGSQKESWWNSVDTSKVPLDTTLPSLHDLGLDSVLKYAALLGVHLGHTLPDIITSATASPNPTGAGTVVSFQTGREAYMQVAVFDLLGEQVGNNSFEGVLEPGSHKIPISTQSLRSGTYYVRITTTYGEVQTVKLVKQE